MLKTWHQSLQTEISYMNKLFIFSLMLFLSISVNAQKKTYYYKLTKKSINGATSTNVSGGQFITFMSDICYESTKEGIGVGHGNMTLQKALSDSNFRTYMGGCYYGSESSYKFTSDLSTLNVITQNGDVYLYKRSTPPSGATTCSLIKSRSKSNTTTTIVEQPQRQPQPMQVWVQCGLCNGSGQCHVCLGTGRGAMSNGSCLICGYSGRCTHCAGQGGHYEVQYH